MNNKPKFSNEAGPPASISRNPPALTIHLAWSEARLVSNYILLPVPFEPHLLEMTITADLFQAYLKCPMKCWLRAKKSAKPRQETPILNGLNGR